MKKCSGLNQERNLHRSNTWLWTRILVKNISMDLYFVCSQDVNWWTGVVWIIVMFLSAVWTLILTAPIHCRASIVEQCYILISYLIRVLQRLPSWKPGRTRRTRMISPRHSTPFWVTSVFLTCFWLTFGALWETWRRDAFRGNTWLKDMEKVVPFCLVVVFQISFYRYNFGTFVLIFFYLHS